MINYVSMSVEVIVSLIFCSRKFAFSSSISLLFILILILAGSSIGKDALTNSAFCISPEKQSVFPVSSDNKSSHCAKLWIWDAVYSPHLHPSRVFSTDIVDKSQGVMEILIHPRSACEFNKSRWREFASTFPEFKDRVKYDPSHEVILTKQCPSYPSLHNSLNGKRVICSFPRSSNNEIVNVQSKQILVSKGFVNLSPIRIECPVPHHLNLSSLVTVTLPQSIYESEYTDLPISERSVSVPFCSINPENRKRNQFHSSVCTVVHGDNIDKLEMFEWLEYHLGLGVDHFFIYDSSRYLSRRIYAQHINSYIKKGLVTIVSWPYENCIEGFGSGRSVNWNQKNETLYFKPPSAINQATALASCITRFKHTSRYIISIDIDEYIYINSRKWGSAVAKLSERKGQKLLPYFIDKMTSSVSGYPKSALRLKPLMMYYCPHLSKQRPQSKSRISLQLDKFSYYTDWSIHEVKLIMDTSEIAMFWVHYLTELRHFTSTRDFQYEFAYTLPSVEAGLLHVKKVTAQTFASIDGKVPFNKTLHYDFICSFNATYLPITSDYHFSSNLSANGTLFQLDHSLLRKVRLSLKHHII